MSVFARAFVAIIFLVFAASFFGATGLMIYEFREAEWFRLMGFYSHHFLFFPVFGTIALIAFYLPCAVAVDLYWSHIRSGKLILIGAMLANAVLAFFIAQMLQGGGQRSLWEIKPEVLLADQGRPAGCLKTQQGCDRVPVMEAFRTLTDESNKRAGLSRFVRDCDPDPLVAIPQDLLEKRYCFASQSMKTAQECCLAQRLFVVDVNAMQAPAANQSLSHKLHRLTLPIDIYFLLILFFTAYGLARRREVVDQVFTPFKYRLQRGVLVGALAMLLWPILNHAYLQSTAVLYGSGGDSSYRLMAPLFSLLFGAWALMLLIFYFRRQERFIESVGKVGGVLGGAIAFFSYEQIIDGAVRIAGSGTDFFTLALALGAAITVFAVMMMALYKSAPPKPAVALGSTQGTDPVRQINQTAG